MAEHVGRECAVLAHTFGGPDAHARADQLVQASTSIGLHIAEGCECGTVVHFRRFIQRARGSAQETLAMLRMIVPADEMQRSTIRTLQSRTVLILKLLTRLYKHPPADWSFH